MFGKITFLIMLLSSFFAEKSFAQVEETNFYTLDFTTKNKFHNTYLTSYIYPSEGVDWEIFGAHNSDGVWSYMRTGGTESKNTTKKSYYESQGKIKGTVSKVVLRALNTTSNSSFKMISIQLLVSNTGNFKNYDYSQTLKNNDIATTMTFSPAEGEVWKDAYYKFIFSWENTRTSNYGMDVTKVEFYTTDPVANIGTTCYSTLYYSDKALTVPEKVTATTYKVNEDRLAVSKEYKSGEVIPAREAVVLKAEEGGKYVFSVSEDTETVKDENNMLSGSDEEEMTTGGSYYYMLSLNSNNDSESIGFYWGSENGRAFMNGAHKAYLALSEAMSKSYVLGDATTGLKAIETENASHEAVYNLSGQRVGAEYKGIVIENGKKIIRK